MIKCFECGHPIDIIGSVSRSEDCDKCNADVRVCKNCRFYDQSSYNECRESSAEVVREKDRANFCDYFEPGNAEGGSTSRDQLLSEAEKLFKK